MNASRDPHATRKAILDAAESVFLERGFADASMSHIARQAKVTKSLLHHHFGSKDGLWEQVKVRRFSTYAEAQMQALENTESSAELLRESMQAYFRFLQANPQLVRILAWVFLEHQQEDECLKMDQVLVDAGTQKIREAQEAGELRPDIHPAFILFTMIGIAQHWFQDRTHILGHLDLDLKDGELDEAYLQDVVKIFFEGVLPR